MTRCSLPFNIELPKYNKETIEAMEEAVKITKDQNVEGYSSMEELKKALLD